MKQRPLVVATVVAVVLIVVGSAIWYFVGPNHRQVQSASQAPVVGKAQLGHAAPQFEVSTTAGLFDLSRVTRPVFLEIFATWCPHCQREAAVIDRLYRVYGSRVQFVGVSGSNTAMDGTSTASAADVIAWTRRFNVQYPVAYDPLLNVASLYLQGGFPTIVLIDRSKRVVYLDSGEVSYGVLSAHVKKLLGSR